MKSIWILLILFCGLLHGEQFVSIDPVMLYEEGMHAASVEDQTRLFNKALVAFLNQKPQNPSAIWHYDVASCFLALREPGAAIYHYLEAKRLDPSLTSVDKALAQARESANLQSKVEELRPIWVLPFFSRATLEISFIVLCLAAFFVSSLGLWISYPSLLMVGKWMSFAACLSGVFLLARMWEPLEGVVVAPIKLLIEPEGEALPRAMLPGEQVHVVGMQNKMIHVETSEGQYGWISDKNCWILSVN